MKTGHIICGIALAALTNCVSFVLGQEQGGFAGNKVTNLTKSDLVGVPNKQVIANIYEVPAGAMVPRHFHHGDEFHLVLAGEWAAEVEGRPIKNLKTGESQYVEGGRWHGGKVISSEPLRLLGLMIVDKDKPIVEVVKYAATIRLRHYPAARRVGVRVAKLLTKDEVRRIAANIAKLPKLLRLIIAT